MLVYLLPEHIYDKFMSNPSKKSEFKDDLRDVTLLYADIAGFTSYSAKVSPK